MGGAAQGVVLGLARAVARELERETPAGPEVERFARTALGGADDAALAALLADPADPDAAALAELLLFPGRAMQQALEPALAGADAALGGDAAPALGRALAALAPRARFTLPGGLAVALAPDARACAGVAVRLRPGHGAPPALARAVDAALAPQAALAARAALRHSRCPWTARNVDLLARLAASPLAGPELPALLAYACALLPGLDEGADLAVALARAHAAALRHLEAHQRFARRLAEQNFETLALRGERAPHADPEALRREMRAADRLSRILCGVPAAAPGVAHQNLGARAPGDGLLDPGGPDSFDPELPELPDI